MKTEGYKVNTRKRIVGVALSAAEIIHAELCGGGSVSIGLRRCLYFSSAMKDSDEWAERAWANSIKYEKEQRITASKTRTKGR
jgi:hypothetical protein